MNRAVLFLNIVLHTSFNFSSNCHIFSSFFLIMLQTISPFKCSKWNCSFLKHVFKLFNFHLWRTINISNIFMQAFKRVRLRVIEKIKVKICWESKCVQVIWGIKSNLCWILKKWYFLMFEFGHQQYCRKMKGIVLWG